VNSPKSPGGKETGPSAASSSGKSSDHSSGRASGKPARGDGTTSHRVERVEKQIRVVISDFMSRKGLLLGPLGLLSVLRVIASKDLRTVRTLIVLTAMDGGAATEADKKQILAKLKHHAFDMQADINSKLRMKYSPRLMFEFDTGHEKSVAVQASIRDIEKNKVPRSED
jgi:ribosome-binding factor A